MKWLITLIFVLKVTVPVPIWMSMTTEMKESVLLQLIQKYDKLQSDCNTIRIDLDVENPVTFIASCPEISI